MTKPVCKPLLPVYDKPLIYIPSPFDAGGIRMSWSSCPGRDGHLPGSAGRRRAVWPEDHLRGAAGGPGHRRCLLIGREFVGEDRVCLVLGDNIFYAPTLGDTLKKAAANEKGATVFGYWVEDPHPFGVVEFDKDGKAISIEEKPRHPKSNYVIPGLYFYDNQVMEIAGNLKPSARGELEITDVNLEYLHRGQLQVVPLEKDFTWLDAGTADSLLDAGRTIKEIQDETGRYVAVWRSWDSRRAGLTRTTSTPSAMS